MECVSHNVEPAPPGWVYVLHFDEPICHARHYTGSTLDLRARLIAHALGRGARLTQVARERGIAWRLTALGATTGEVLRKLERGAKDWKGADQFCPICTRAPHRIPGTTPYPVAMLPFPVSSTALELEAA